MASNNSKKHTAMSYAVLIVFLSSMETAHVEWRAMPAERCEYIKERMPPPLNVLCVRLPDPDAPPSYKQSGLLDPVG